MLSTNKTVYRRYLVLHGLCLPSVKTTTYVCNRFNTSFCAEDHKTNQTISNLNGKFFSNLNVNQGGLSRVSFLPLAPTRLRV